MSTPQHGAPNGPGSQARWTSSAKTGVGTALSNRSNVWFTLSHGIFNEIYYPRLDQACIRDMGFIVTDGADFFSEEKRDADSQVHWMADGVPAFRLVNTCLHGRYRISKEIVTDPQCDAVLQRTRFAAQEGTLSDYKLFILLAPHLGNQGGDFPGVARSPSAAMLRLTPRSVILVTGGIDGHRQRGFRTRRVPARGTCQIA